jgi:hypothetical protein
VPQSAVHALIGGGGVAGVWVLCFMVRLIAPYWVVRDKDAQITELKTAVESQTRRADLAQETAHQSNLILAGLRQEARGAPLGT